MAGEMYDCEVKKLYQRASGKILEWVVAPVTSLASTPKDGGIRCQHCHGRVRVHKQHVPHGPADHVEHLRRRDSENCRGGHHFKGIHRMSDDPVA